MLKLILRKVHAWLLSRRLKAFGVGSKWYGGDVHCPAMLSIGNYVYVGPEFSAHAFGGIAIGDGTVLGPRVTIHSRNHVFESAPTIPYGPEYELRPVVVGKGVWLGDSVMVLPGANIGDGCVIGAGSVVSGHIPSYSVAAGNPARVLRERCDSDQSRLHIEAERFYLKKKGNFS